MIVKAGYLGISVFVKLLMHLLLYLGQAPWLHVVVKFAGSEFTWYQNTGVNVESCSIGATQTQLVISAG